MKKFLLIFALMALGACANKGNETSKETEQKQQSNASVSSQVAASDAPLVMDDKNKLCVDKNNELAFTLLQKQSKKEPYKSFTFSPLSVSCALAMTSNGASGATLKEIEELIGPSPSANSFYGKYVAHFLPSVVMSNYLAMNNNFSINQDFIKSIKGIYNAQVSNLNFGTSEATKQLNNWIKQQSNGELDNVIDITDSNELVYLINYMRFKALWKSPFHPGNTDEEVFTNDDGKTVQVPMMFQQAGEYYYEDNNCQAISMKYKDSEFRMLIVLPKHKKINDFIASMDTKEFNHIISALKAPAEYIELNLPRFSTTCNLDLCEMLKALLPTAFNKKADFSRLSSVKSYINRFTQDTKISVTEHGTEASNATVQSEIFLCISPQFTANHPFLYFIYDETTHAILQAGQFCGDGFKVVGASGKKNINVEDENDAVSGCAHMPSFPGGDQALMKFINNNMKYPPEALKNGIEGKVIIQFVVTNSGKVGKVKVARAVNKELDQEAVRLIKTLPDFSPGRNAMGEPVNVWYILPVIFKLLDNN